MAELKIGDRVWGKRFGKFEHDFSGEIEKIYDNSVLIHILDFDAEDKVLVTELNDRAIVRKADTTLEKMAAD